MLISHLPLLDHGAVLISGKVHAMEVGQTILALHVFNNKLELAEGYFIILEIG